MLGHYKNAWSTPLSNPDVALMAESIWYELLKPYSEEIIMQGFWVAIKHYNPYPPTAGEFLDVVKPIDRQAKAEDDMYQRQKPKRLTEKTCRVEEFLERHPQYKDLWEQNKKPTARTRAAHASIPTIRDDTFNDLDGLVPWQRTM